MSIESRLEELERLVGALTEAQNDKVDLDSSFGFPIGDYIDLSSTIPLVADTAYDYTAPADGWLYVAKRAAGDKQYLGCYGSSLFTHMEMWGNTDFMLFINIPMRKGQTVTDIRTNATGSDMIVRFIYAKKTN